MEFLSSNLIETLIQRTLYVQLRHPILLHKPPLIYFQGHDQCFVE